MLSEKKAIEKLKKIREDTIKANECGLSNNDFKEEIEVYNTNLNLITKLQKKNEHQTEKINNQKVELAILNEKQKDMNKLINDVKSYEGQFKRQEKEIREKNKQIDLMAGYINYLSDELVRLTGENKLKFCDMETCLIDVYCEDCIKKYFEKLAKEKGE